MRRLLSIAALAAVAVTPIAGQAQMRGMGGGGRVSSPSRGPVTRTAPAVAPRVAAGPVGVRTVTPSGAVGVRTVTPSGVVAIRGPFPGSRFHQPGFVHRGCFNNFNCRNRFFFNPGFGFGFGTGFGFGFGGVVPSAYPYYSAPYYPSDYYPSAQSPYYPGEYYTMTAPQPANTENANDVYLAAMLQRLSDEVEGLKNEQKHQAGAGASAPPAKSESAAPAVTFVFHDGKRITARNYAVAGPTLWIFSENAARKYLLADLDRAATEQANAANGIELRLPEPAPAR